MIKLRDILLRVRDGGGTHTFRHDDMQISLEDFQLVVAKVISALEEGYIEHVTEPHDSGREVGVDHIVAQGLTELGAFFLESDPAV